MELEFMIAFFISIADLRQVFGTRARVNGVTHGLPLHT